MPRISPTKSPESRCRAALFFLALFLVFFSLASEVAFNHYRLSKHSKRNPFFRKAWVEHVYRVSPKHPDEKLIIILSNSQGYGREFPDDKTYPVLLEKKLREKTGSDVRVLNWSVPGLAAPEFVILAAAAHRLNPDIFVVVAGKRAFSSGHYLLDQETQERQPWATDSHYLLNHNDVKRYVPKSFIDHFFHPGDTMELFIAKLLAPWRYKDLPAAYLDRYSITMPFFPKHPAADWFLDMQNKIPLAERINTSRNKRKRSVSTSNKPVSEELLDQFIQATDTIRTKKIFIAMPERARRPGQTQQPIHGLIRQPFEKGGYEIINMSGAIPPEHFISQSHLHQQGHEIMAEKLSEVLSQ
ncbi:MAG: hypothetical protein KKE17_05265 [Proteobacteria bacterium]|nr:hypothetical protein [Pseudomonadota bacterium]MBU1709399.1 hypothetical protein [Pseudomonadota bacterium]